MTCYAPLHDANKSIEALVIDKLGKPDVWFVERVIEKVLRFRNRAVRGDPWRKLRRLLTKPCEDCGFYRLL